MISKVPFLTSNEEELVVVKIHVKNGEYVKKKQILFDVETTKTSLEIESEFEGYIHFNFKEKSRLAFNSNFYEVTKEKVVKPEKVYNQIQEKIITNEAKEIILDYKINLKKIKEKIITKEVLSKYIANNIENKLEIPTGKKNSVLIVGASYHGMTVHDFFIDSKKYNPVAFIDYSNIPSKKKIYGKGIYRIDDIESFYKKGTKNIHINTNNNNLTKRIFEMAKKIGFNVVSIIHPSSVVSSTADLGECIFVGPNSVVGPNVKIGSFSKILNKASVAHDSIIGENVQISDGATIAGNVKIGDNSLIGINSAVINKTVIGRNVIVISGKTVTYNLQDNSKFDQ